MEEYYIDQNINFKVHIEENIKSKKLSKNKKEKNNKNTNNKIYKSNLNKVSNNKKDILYTNIRKENKNKINSKNNILPIRKLKINIFNQNKKINIIYFFIIINLIFPSVSRIKNEIRIKIDGTGYQKICCYYICPNEIYINNTKVGENKCSVILNDTETIIRLILFDRLLSTDSMFHYLENITEIDIYKFDNSRVTSASYMFSSCSSLEYINLKKFDTSRVNYMNGMFYGCSELKSLDISNFNTSNVSDMNYMFYGCSKLKSLDFSNFNTSNVFNMRFMFSFCDSLEYINLSNFHTSNVIDMSRMFYGCSELKSLDISNFNTSNVININTMFAYCQSLEYINLNNFDTSNVNDMSNMFYGCIKLKSLDISNFNTSNVFNMEFMFNGCPSLEYINLSNFDTSKVINMKFMFYACRNLKSLDISNFNISSVINMDRMFAFCYSLKYINLKNAVENNNLNVYNMFSSVPENIVYCIDDINAPKIYLMLKNKKCSTLYCLNNWEEKQKNIILINKVYECIIPIPTTSYIYDSTNIAYITENNNIINKSSEDTDISQTILKIEETDKATIDFFEKNCSNCFINIIYVKDNLTLNAISNFKDNYINNIINNIDNTSVYHYINTDLNFTITIFNMWDCTKLLFEYGYFEINPKFIFKGLNIHLNDIKDYIFVYTNMKRKSYIEIYDINTKSKININLNCPNCFKENILKIKNNFTHDLYSELGNIIFNKIIENNIDLFNKNHPIFNDICKNFTIEDIDIPIKERKEIMFLGLKEKEIICNNINCNIEKFFLYNFTGICNCKISDNFNNVISTNFNDNYSYEDYKKFINSKININSFLIFKCNAESLRFNNIKINIGFYISVIILIIQMLLYISYIFFYCKIKNDNKSNPPKIQKFEIEEEEEDESNYKSSKIKNDSDGIKKNFEIYIDNNNKYENNNLNYSKDKNDKYNEDKNNLRNINTIENINIDKNKESINKDKLILQSNINNYNNFEYNTIEESNNYEKLNIILSKKKKRSIKNRQKLPPIQKNITSSKEFLVEEKKDNVEKNNIKENNNYISNNNISKKSLKDNQQKEKDIQVIKISTKTSFLDLLAIFILIASDN